MVDNDLTPEIVPIVDVSLGPMPQGVVQSPARKPQAINGVNLPSPTTSRDSYDYRRADNGTRREARRSGCRDLPGHCNGSASNSFQSSPSRCPHSRRRLGLPHEYIAHVRTCAALVFPIGCPTRTSHYSNPTIPRLQPTNYRCFLARIHAIT